jgi:hypothetical protein
MLSFTLSQSGMVVLMGRVRRVPPGASVRTSATTIHFEPGWWWKRGVNAVGGVTTGVVLLVLVATKFVDGAWLVVVAVPLIVLLLRSINEHYRHVAEALRLTNLSATDLLEVADVAIVPIADVHCPGQIQRRVLKWQPFRGRDCTIEKAQGYSPPDFGPARRFSVR